MNSSTAKTIIKYIEANLENKDKLNKALREIKIKISENKQNVHVFRKFELTSILFKVLGNKDERVQKWVFSIFTSCVLEEEFREEICKHENGIPVLVEFFKSPSCKYLHHRACRVIGQQCYHLPSCAAFHKLNTVQYIISFLKESKSDEERESAIKTLRCLTSKILYYSSVLKEDGLVCICQHGLAATNRGLNRESLLLIFNLNKYPNSDYFSQLRKGTNNLQVLSKLYESDERDFGTLILNIFLTIFWHHSSASNPQEYSTNCLVLDDLCMAKFPYMIVSKLQDVSDLEENQKKLCKGESNLLLALCKFCELDKQWKQFSLNVLPSYYERLWMQLTDANSIPMLICFLSSQRHDLVLLQALLRGLLGMEYLHSNRVKVLYACFKARLLPLLEEIFDTALRKICDDNPTDTTNIPDNDCRHYVTENKTQQRKSFSKEVSRELLDLVDHSQSRTPTVTRISLNKSPPKPASTVCYKNMNKIKFRTGSKGRREREDDRKRCRSSHSESMSEDFNSSSSSSSSSTENSFSVLGESPFSFIKNEVIISNETLIWLNILECIIRLLYQIVSVKQDISSLCRQFMLKVYHYIHKSSVVHPSALKLLAAIAKNSSSIQYTLDIMFIPMLAVDLADGMRENCSQCALIQGGVNDFLVNVQSFFNHYHQYGRCEVANRLNPSKPECTKHSCIVALTHVIRCPSLLNTFFLNHRGLEALLLLLNRSESDQSKMHLYAMASLCGISHNLQKEYKIKNKNVCLFCTRNLATLACSADAEQNKKQLLNLIKLNDDCNPSEGTCNIKTEKDRNFTFRLKNKLIMVNKDKLAMRNDVFRAMLFGSFSESSENCICLEDVEDSAMELVIHFAYGCVCGTFLNKDINVYVELLYLAQMYFLPELQIFTVHQLVKLLEAGNIFPLIENIAKYLEKDLLQHLFCSLMSESSNIYSKQKWINQILNSNLKDNFIENVSDGLTHLLKLTSSLCNCDIYRTYL